MGVIWLFIAAVLPALQTTTLIVFMCRRAYPDGMCDIGLFHVRMICVCSLNVAGAEIEREDEFLELVLADGSDVQLRAVRASLCRMPFAL